MVKEGVPGGMPFIEWSNDDSGLSFRIKSNTRFENFNIINEANLDLWNI